MAIKNHQDFVTARLTNYTRTSEGTILPPRMIGGPLRVPVVSNLRVLKAESYLGGTQFTLAWVEPNDTSGNISHYLVLVTDSTNPVSSQQSTQVSKSPAVIKVTSSQISRILLKVQTVLKNGMLSDFDFCPTVVGVTVNPASINQDLSPVEYTYGAGTFDITAATILNNLVLLTGDTTGGAITFNLPSLDTVRKARLYVKKYTGAANLVVDPYSTETVDSAATRTVSGGETIQLFAPESGTNWILL